jgi:tetratricopeptide (TPR) repeat protein
MDTAVALYQRALQADPASLVANLNIAAAYLEQGDLPKALAAGEMALALDPESRDARLNFALSLDRAGFHDDAADEAERVITAAPNDVAAHLLLGNLYAQHLGRPERARRHYSKVLELVPNHPQSVAIRRWLTDNR